MKKRKIIPYNPKLKEFARDLRNHSIEYKHYWILPTGWH